MAGPAAAALARTDARDSGAESIAPTSSAARELPGSPPSSGERQLSREHRASRVGGALPWRPAPLGHGTLCETLGLCARGGAECRAAPAGAVGSPMGLSKSKHKSRKGKGAPARRLLGRVAAVRAGLRGCWAPRPRLLVRAAPESSLMTVPRGSFHACSEKWK